MAVATDDSRAATARAFLDLAERELKSRSPLLEAIGIVLVAAGRTARDVTPEHSERAALLERHEALRLLLFAAQMRETGEIEMG